MFWVCLKVNVLMKRVLPLRFSAFRENNHGTIHNPQPIVHTFSFLKLCTQNGCILFRFENYAHNKSAYFSVVKNIQLLL